jgi:hypothetical protein
MSVKAALSYAQQVDGHRISVFDGLLALPQLAELYRILLQAGYTRSEIARPDTADYRHWATEIPVAKLPAMPFTGPMMEAVVAHAPGTVYRPYRSYVNVAHYGDMLFSHVDCVAGSRELTALWYVCEQWDHEWGGETVFFDEHRDVRAAVSPRPGRLVVFDGEILHAGRPPNRNCHVPRFTLAVKLEPVAS